MALQSASFQTSATDFPGGNAILAGQVLDLRVLDPTENNEQTSLLEVGDEFDVQLSWELTGSATPVVGGSWIVSLYSNDLDGTGAMTGLIAGPETIPIVSGTAPLTFLHTFKVAPPTPKAGLYQLTVTINHSPTGDPAELSEMAGFAQATPIHIFSTVLETNGGNGGGPYTGGGQDAPQPYTGGGDSGGGAYSGGGVRQRYLKGRCPESISVYEPFSLLASIVLVAGPSSAALKPFDVPSQGKDVLLVVYAPGLRLLGNQRQTVHVPADGDSEPVMFELQAEMPGVHTVSVTAWIDGSYLGELQVDITAERDHKNGAHRDVLAEITTESTQGAVSLVVRFDPRQNAYRFEFRDVDNPKEVTSNLAYEPGPRVEQLVAGLDDLARGRSGYDAGQARAYLVNAGAALWRELVPQALREQFWDRRDRIRQLTILADEDTVPWELLYPMDPGPGHDQGFLVEQFPVTRATFGRQPARRLSLWPARFVLPGGSPAQAQDEIDAMRLSLDPGQPPGEVISALSQLQDLIASGEFGLLHFACHNTYTPAAGSSIKLGNAQFTPTLLTTAAINKELARSAPTVFLNACRSAGLNATYNQLDGWASKFLEAGAGAFIGSLWAVSDGAAREFAQEFYGQLRARAALGDAVKSARAAAATQPDDPTWLAYTVYGDPRATLGQQRS
jgi:hypothetical protein